MKANLGGTTHEIMEVRGIREVLLTMAFCRAYATATAIAPSEVRQPIRPWGRS